MKEKDKSLFEHNGKTYKLVKQPKEGKSCREFCSLYNLGCEKLCVKAYNELDNPNFGLIEAVFVEADESENKETGMRENEIDYKKLYEEEHERYEGALERARGHHSVASHYNNTGEIQELEYIFPELKESEDERIRKELINFIKQEANSATLNANRLKFKSMLAWLEKQGEQKPIRPVWKYKKDHTPLLRDSFILNKYGCVAKSPSGALVSDVWVLDFGELAKLPKEEFERQGEQKPVDKVESKFKVGDWVVNEYGFVMRIVDVQDSHYVYIYEGRELSATIEQMENSCHLWNIEDAKDGDVLVASDSSIFLLKGVIDGACKHYVALTTDNVVKFNEGLEHYWETSTSVHPATKEQRDLLFSKMKEAGYEWDVKDKMLKKIEQNHAWSDEDETGLEDALWAIEQARTIAKDENDMGNLWYAEKWLKSLKDRVQPQLKQELRENAATTEYIDLGLPSGTLWKPFNEDGYYTYDEAVEKFGDKIPSKDQWEELKDNCTWEWKGNGYDVTGPNGNMIFLPTNGYRLGTNVHSVGMYGSYWSSKHYDNDFAYYMGFGANFLDVNYYSRNTGRSVRLVK